MYVCYVYMNVRIYVKRTLMFSNCIKVAFWVISQYINNRWPLKSYGNCINTKYRCRYKHDCNTNTNIWISNSKSFSNGVGGSARSHRCTGEIVYSQEAGLVWTKCGSQGGQQVLICASHVNRNLQTDYLCTEGFLYLITEGFLYLITEGFLYLITEGFLYLMVCVCFK